MLTCVYGSSEYAQAFSRVGSLFQNTYIVNPDVQLNKCNFETKDSTTKFESLEFSFNNTPVTASKGIIVGTDYQKWALEQAGLPIPAGKRLTCARLTLITTRPMCADTDGIGTFIFPPGSVHNTHPIRIFQFNHCNSACPRDFYLIMASMQISNNVEDRDKEMEAMRMLI